ncbi:MAG: amidohydrolase [Candidatus Bathyarchaeota archaeon]|nr:MAG: amidohydrolase [Candidatus Bathyarchaeota archaeon]
MNADILIKNCMVLPMDGRGIIAKGIIATKDNTINYAGPITRAPNIRAEKTLDATGMVAIPGLINCHTHLAMTLFRGIAEDQPLETWLTESIWPLEAKLGPQDIYHGSLLGCLEMIKSGTTCFADMYFHEETVAKAVQKAGIRAVLAPGLLESLIKDLAEETIKQTIQLAERYHKPNSTIKIQLGPHTVYTCSLDFLKKVRETATRHNLDIHIHLAESEEMANQTKAEYGKTEAQLLQSIGFLGSDVLAAHCIHVNQEDMQTLAKYNVKIAYNPVANMKLAQGTARIPDLQKLGITIGLGTDGPASNNTLDLLRNMKIAALLQKAHYRDSTVLPAKNVLKMATKDAAMALRLDDTIGSLEPGKRADIALIDLKKPHLTPLHNPYANIIYSASGSDVQTLIVNGKVIMENRNVKTLNEEEIMEKAGETSLNLLTR